MATTGERFERAVSIMARLRGPGGCPWDREQTFDTIKPYTLEEAYEVVEAIDARDWDELTGELGDLLLQVLFYAEMAAEEKRFSIDDVLDRLSNKLVDRHPHVFGEVKADTPGEVLRNWQALKAEEKKKRQQESGEERKAAGPSRVRAGRSLLGHAVADGGLQDQLARGARRLRLAEHRRPVRQAERRDRRSCARIWRTIPRPVRSRNRRRTLPARVARRFRPSCAPGWKTKSATCSSCW